MVWVASDSDEVLGYSVYRDGNILDSTTETSYNDTSADFNVEYCYYIVANYGELGDSQPGDEECTMWEILAPDDLTADGLDGYVHLESTTTCLNKSNILSAYSHALPKTSGDL